MRCCHFSLRWLFGVISFVAVSCGLLIYTRPLLATLTFTAVLVVLLAAIPGAIYNGGEKRPFWAGFALFGFVYLWCSTWHTADGLDPLRNRLLTTSILDWCYGIVPATRTTTRMVQSPGGMPGMGGSGSMMSGGMGSGMMPGAAPGMTAVAAPPDWDDFMTTGHSLFNIAFAFLGGIIARGFYHRSPSVSAG